MRRNTRVLWAALAAVLIAGGCTKAPNDAAISEQIKAQMFSDAALKDSYLQVASHKGEVILSGSVPSDAARLEAYKLASQTPGVKKVDDQMTVAVPQQAAQETAQAQPAPPPAPEAAPVEPVRTHKRHHPKPQPALEPAAQPAPDQEADNTPPPPAPQAQDAQPAPAPVPPPQQAPPPPPPPQPKNVEIPSGSTMTIRMIDSIDSKVNQAGEIFHASLDAPLVSGDQVIVPKGADVYVRLVQASSAGHVKGKSELHLELVKMDFQGRSYPLTSSTYSLSGASRGKRTAETVGGGAALGALLGAVIGGGKGAAIGAGVGAGAGGVYTGATRGKQVKIPSETKLDFQLEAPLDISYMPRSPQGASQNN
jgi:hypothetical protein